jgi:hypothetical protein
MTKIVSNLLGLLILISVCVVFILFAIYPYHPVGLIGWIMLILTAIPIVLGLELIGNGLLENKFVANLGMFGRIFFGIVTVTLITVPILIIWHWVKPYLAIWH